eukprot:3497688-Amphidinium_carterae.1
MDHITPVGPLTVQIVLQGLKRLEEATFVLISLCRKVITVTLGSFCRITKLIYTSRRIGATVRPDVYRLNWNLRSMGAKPHKRHGKRKTKIAPLLPEHN